MLCRQPTMSRRRPHTGEKGRYGLPRSSVTVSGLNVRDIQDALIRAACACGHDPDMVESAKEGENAALHRNSLFLLYDLDMAAVHDALGDELEKLMGIYPNLQGVEPKPMPQRRATDRLPGMSSGMLDQNLSEQFAERCLSTLPNERPYSSQTKVPTRRLSDAQVEELAQSDVEIDSEGRYNGWTEREKIHGRMRALGIPIPNDKPSLWQRFLNLFG